MVSDNLAQLQHLTLGEMLEIPAPNGVIRLPIVGIVVDYSDQQGTILMDRTLFQQYWHDDSVNVFRVYLKPGRAGARRAASAFSSATPAQRQVFVLTNAELKSYILKVTDQWFGLTSVQIAVAVLVAILGIVNTLTVSITDRRRELGVLQAVGGLRGQIRRTIWIEALSIGTLGLVLGFALGAINLYYILQIVHHDIAGMRLDYAFPVDGRRWRWCRRFSARRSSPRSGRRNRRCTVRWWRRSSTSSRYSYSSASTSRARTADSPGPIAATNEAARIVGMVRSTNATGNT